MCMCVTVCGGVCVCVCVCVCGSVYIPCGLTLCVVFERLDGKY